MWLKGVTALAESSSLVSCGSSNSLVVIYLSTVQHRVDRRGIYILIHT